MKLRMRSWYWGKYVTTPTKNTNRSDYEPYVEADHGWHHSEEYKSGYRKVPYTEEEKC